MADKEERTIDIVGLANCFVFHPDGSKSRLGLVWQNQKTILVFLRHFACIACRAHAAQVWQERDKYAEAGTQIVFIGNGRPHFIQSFKDDLGIENAQVFTDPSLNSFRAAGFKRGFFVVVQPQSVVNAIRLAVQGHKQVAYSAEAGTHWQLGGVVAIHPGGKVVYHFISQSLGDFPPEEDVDDIALGLVPKLKSSGIV